MPKLLHRQVFTQAFTHKFFTQMRQMLLHTGAFEHRCLSTQKHLPRYALTYTRLCTQKLLDADSFQGITGALTQRSLYTENLLHTEAFTHKLFHRSFYTEKLLHREAFEHRSFYTQKLVHTEAFTHRSFYTEKPLHTNAFPQKKRFHRAAFTTLQKIAILRKFLTFGHHIVRKGCIRRWKSQFLTLDNHFAWKGCAWRFKMGKVAILHQFLNVCIWREKTSVFPQLLPFDFHATLASEPSKSQFYTNFLTVDPKGLRRVPPNLHFATCLDVRPARSLQRVAGAQKKFTFHHMLGRSKRTICRWLLRAKKFRISLHVWVSDAPQRVTFRKPPPGCPCRQREIEELEKSDFAGVQIQCDHLEVSWTPM